MGRAKQVGFVVVLSSTGLLGRQVYLARKHLSNLLPQNAGELGEKRPEYVYCDPPPGLFSPFLPSLPGHYWRLLDLAQSGNRHMRLAAVQVLSHSADRWSPGELYQLALSCDIRTAVGLARCSGKGLFLAPPRVNQLKPEELVQAFLALFENLRRADLDDPVRFSSWGLVDMLDGDDGVKKDHRLLFCLRLLLSYSAVASRCERVVRAGGLKLLLQTALVAEDSNAIHIRSVLGKIVANIAVNPTLHTHLFHAGWVGILADWSREADVRISLPASRALLNLDRESQEPVLEAGVFQLHPSTRPASSSGTKRPVEVVFVHGMLGGLFWTWRQRDEGKKKTDKVEKVVEEVREEGALSEALRDVVDQLRNAKDVNQGVLDEVVVGRKRTQCWPRDWLPSDCQLDLRVIGLDFDTHATHWAAPWPSESSNFTIAERSAELLSKLRCADVGSHGPIVWVTHSMGGLLVKRMLVEASRSQDPELQQISSKTKAVLFYSTPHRGTPAASLRPHTRMILLPTSEVDELRLGSSALVQLHSEFTELCRLNKYHVVSFAETRPTYLGRLGLRVFFVDPDSADPGFGSLYRVPFDHLDVCKPEDRRSFVYRKLVEVVLGVAAKGAQIH